MSTPKVTHAGGPQAKKIGTGVKLYKHHEWVCSLIDDVDEFLLNAIEPHENLLWGKANCMWVPYHPRIMYFPTDYSECIPALHGVVDV